jgi:HK97 gp10 family phage protein
MSDGVTVKFSGLDELQKELASLPLEVSRKVVRGSLKEGAEEMREGMHKNAPKDSGFLSEHFNVKVRVSTDEIAGSAFIGPAGKMYYPGRGSKDKGVATGRYPHKGGLVPVASVARFLEFGTSKMPAHPFMRQTFDQLKMPVFNTIVSEIKSILQKKGLH